MFGTYREAIEILRHMVCTTTQPDEATTLTKAIAAIQAAWHDEEKAFSRAYNTMMPIENDDKEIH